MHVACTPSNAREPVWQAMGPELSANETEPVGRPDPGAVTEMVAVKVTIWPAADGSEDDLRAIDVPAGETFWARVPVEGSNTFVSVGVNDAVMVYCDPLATSWDVWQTAWPPERATFWHSVMGAPEAGVAVT